MITKATAEDVSALNKLINSGIVASILKGWTTEANILEGRTNEVELIEIIADTKNDAKIHREQSDYRLCFTGRKGAGIVFRNADSFT
jgi:hypothetical protein